MTSRVKVLGYRFAVVVADVSHMLRKMNREGPGSLMLQDDVARLTGDGIYQVVVLTRESPLDGHVTLGASFNKNTWSLTSSRDWASGPLVD